MKDSNKQIAVTDSDNLQNLIYTIRGVQVMLDRDLAELYQVETRTLKQAVKRNMERFPTTFMFELDEVEIDFVVSQSVIPSKKYFGGSKPFAFTEQGVAMLSAVLRSERAVKVSIQIINAFVGMRKFLAAHGQVFQRIDTIERKQLETDNKIDKIFKAIEEKDIIPKQGIFFDGQVFDAHKFVSDIIRTAKKSIAIIDNFVDDTVLTLLTKREKNIAVTIYTKTISKRLTLDVKKYNAQYPPIQVKKFENSHDRFIIIDDKEIYHLGASLKDLGKKWFAFSKFDSEVLILMKKLSDVIYGL